jgi:hypothetical protein
VAVSYKAAPSSTSEGLRHVRDIHLVMAPHERGAVTFCVLVDGDLLATLMGLDVQEHGHRTSHCASSPLHGLAQRIPS